MYAWLDVDNNNYIKRVSIKKAFTDIKNKYAIIGSMTFKKGKYFKEGLNKIYETNYRTNGKFYVDNMIEPLVNLGYKKYLMLIIIYVGEPQMIIKLIIIGRNILQNKYK